jgi:hypothetical protein
MIKYSTVRIKAIKMAYNLVYSSQCTTSTFKLVHTVASSPLTALALKKRKHSKKKTLL